MVACWVALPVARAVAFDLAEGFVSFVAAALALLGWLAATGRVSTSSGASVLGLVERLRRVLVVLAFACRRLRAK